MESALSGLMEYRAAQADLEGRKAMAVERMATAQKMQSDMRKDQEASALMQKFLGGMSPDQVASSDDPQMQRQLALVGGLLLKTGNIDKGLAITKQASEMGVKQAQEKKALMSEAAARNQAIGSRYAAVTDQESYDLANQQTLEEYGRLPAWASGNYEQDKGKIKFMASQSMKASEQFQAGIRAAHQATLDADLQRKLANDAEGTWKQQQDAKAAQDRLEEQKRENIKRDERAAAAQTGRLDKWAAKEEDSLHKQAQTDLKPTTEALRKTQIARELVMQGNPASDVQLHQRLTDLYSTLRATNHIYQDSASFGGIYEKMGNFLSTHFQGVYSDTNRKNILEMLDTMESQVLRPTYDEYSNHYKDIAKSRGLNEKNILPPDTFGKPAKAAAPSEKPAAKGTFNPGQEDWISRAMKANPGMSREDVINQGKKMGKL